MADVAQFKSHAQWWRDAGTDVAVAEEAVRWLSPASGRDDDVVVELPPSHVVPPVDMDRRSENPAPVEIAPPKWPDSFDALHAFLSDNGPYPGSDYGRRRALPSGRQGAELAILTDFPSAQDVESGQLFRGSEGELLAAMIRATGLDLDACYTLSLTTTRPATGEIPVEDRDAVAAFARHHLTLAAPRRVLLLGDFASRLLLEAPMLESRGSLRYINHNGADMAAINCFHPRTLLARPGFKKQAWQDLQILMKELGR